MRKYLFCIFLALVPLTASANAYHIGVLAYLGELRAIKRWQPTVDYLNQHIPQHHFYLHAIEKVDDISQMVAQQKLDFIITQPASYIDLMRFHGVMKMLTLVRDNGVTKFGSVIFRMKRNRGVNFMVDIPGHQVAAVDPKAFGGWLIAYNELLKNRVDLLVQDVPVRFVGFHDAVVRAVIRGDAVVGIVRTGVLEAMQERGEIDLSDFYVINSLVTQNFPQLHSTRLFPEWVIARARQVPLDLAAKVSQVLLALDAQDEAAIVGGYGGWTVPLNYLPVEALMRDLKFGSFEQAPVINHVDYWVQHRMMIAIVFLSLMFMFVLSVKLRIKNRGLMLESHKHHENIKKLEYMVGHDPLTQLPNRNLLMQLLAKDLQRARRNQSKMALMFIDLDGFKGVNDQLGHDRGDEVLKEVADAIKSVLREGDIVGRFGGDEFIVAINDVSSEKDIEEIALKLNRTVGNVGSLNNTGHKIQASIGVIVSTVKDSSPESLVKLADKVMYEAKSAGKGRHKVLEV